MQLHADMAIDPSEMRRELTKSLKAESLSWHTHWMDQAVYV
jgi:predicted metal-dependent peptidase